eukprot:TRINITY_DN16245_c0_g1_i1.p1 TRINITY_DN16245_c0_g1~~TRINITY_DN16245_c0_g1_i1.p1  ORF type:complete len:122 (-),score=28.27 TRINITY_DN16245_c0_g1_i1:44-358(-)
MSNDLEKYLLDPSTLEATAKAAFKEADKDQSGYLDRSEIKFVLQNSVLQGLDPEVITESQIDHFFHEYDKDKNGTISFDEFTPFVAEVLKSVVALMNQSNQQKK